LGPGKGQNYTATAPAIQHQPLSHQVRQEPEPTLTPVPDEAKNRQRSERPRSVLDRSSHPPQRPVILCETFFSGAEGPAFWVTSGLCTTRSLEHRCCVSPFQSRAINPCTKQNGRDTVHQPDHNCRKDQRVREEVHRLESHHRYRPENCPNQHGATQRR
jgi:hypothetical protein